MTAEVSAKEFDSNSIIDSEIVEQEDEEEELEVEYDPELASSVSNGTITEQVVNDTRTGEAAVPSPKLAQDNSTSELLTENYSEEFETEVEEEQPVEESVDDEAEVEVVEDPDYSSDEDDVTITSKSHSDSNSIKIRCEINISNSAVRSDQEESVVADEDIEAQRKSRTTTTTSSTTSTRVDPSHNPSSNNRFTMDDEIRSWTPSDCNEESHLFDMGILHESMVNLLLLEDRKMHEQRQRMRYKNGTRMSLSFTNERMREIERHNQILVRKIFQQSASPQVTVSGYKGGTTTTHSII